jgi:hypothetical protein
MRICRRGSKSCGDYEDTFLLKLFFYPEDGGDTFLRNMLGHSPLILVLCRQVAQYLSNNSCYVKELGKLDFSGCIMAPVLHADSINRYSFLC